MTMGFLKETGILKVLKPFLVLLISGSEEDLSDTLTGQKDEAYPIFMTAGVLDSGRFFYPGKPHN